MIRFLTTWGYVGLIGYAPGTFASLAALPFMLVLERLGGWLFLLSISVVVFFIGWWASAQYIHGSSAHDPSEIVIDEVVGQWIALLPIGIFTTSDLKSFYIFIGFVLFRLFDISKPLQVRWADQQKSALGVMLDDVIAGIMAALILSLLIIIWGYYG